jgi:hypothetical protein
MADSQEIKGEIMDFEKLSDDELSLKVGECLGGVEFNINNPSDAWPIIVENEIGINFVGAIHCWISESGLSNQFAHANPLRAAMIVYLMMKESQ